MRFLIKSNKKQLIMKSWTCIKLWLKNPFLKTHERACANIHPHCKSWGHLLLGSSTYCSTNCVWVCVCVRFMTGTFYCCNPLWVGGISARSWWLIERQSSISQQFSHKQKFKDTTLTQGEMRADFWRMCELIFESHSLIFFGNFTARSRLWF